MSSDIAASGESFDVTYLVLSGTTTAARCPELLHGLFAPCSFNSLNKLAHGIADNLALSVVAEAIGRGTPVIVGPSLNAPLLNHPEARASLRKLPTWGVIIVPPVDEGQGPRL